MGRLPSCARAQNADPRIAVTLVGEGTFRLPVQYAVIAGLRELSAQQFSYDKVSSGIAVLRASA